MPPVASRLIVVGLGLCSLLLVHGVARADIFHCIDPGGVHIYRDSPCASGTRTAGITVSAPVEPRGKDDDPTYEYERVVAAQTEGMRRIQELEREVAELRAALQSVQVAALPAAVQEPQHPTIIPVQVPASPIVPVQEPVYPIVPVVIVPGCQGRACGQHHRPDHHGDSHRPGQHGRDDHPRERRAEPRPDKAASR